MTWNMRKQAAEHNTARLASIKKAQGGPISIGNHSVGEGASVADIADAEVGDKQEDLSNAMRRQSYSKGFEAGDYRPNRGPTHQNARNLEWDRIRKGIKN